MTRLLARSAAYGLLFLLILLLLIAAGLQTSVGQNLLVGQLNRLLSSPTATVQIDGLSGWVPFDMHLESVALGDTAGDWLTARDLRLHWSAAALLQGGVEVDVLSAKMLHVARRPLPGEDDDDSSVDEPARLPELPQTLPAVSIERIAVEQILLDQPVLGEAARLEAQGRLQSRDQARAADLELSLKRVDQQSAKASLTGTYSAASQHLTLAFEAEEKGGMLARLIKEPRLGEVRVRLNGDGPLADWRGELDATADGIAAAELELSLALDDQPRAMVRGSVRPATDLLAPELLALVGDQASLALELRQAGPQRLTVESLELGVEVGRLRAKGEADFERRGLEAIADLTVPSLAPLSVASGRQLAGAAHLHLALEGGFDQLQGRLEAAADGVSIDRTLIDRLTGVIDWAMLSPADGEPVRFTSQGEGRLAGIRTPSGTAFQEEVDWRFGLAAPIGEPVVVETLRVEAAGASLVGQGTIDPSTLASDIAVVLDVPRLENIAVLAGLPWQGKGRLETKVNAAPQSQVIDVELSGVLDDLENLPPGLAELLGSRADIDASLQMIKDDRLELQTVAIRGQSLDFAADALIGLEPQEELAGKARLHLPKLAALDRLLGRSLEGGALVNADLAGTLDAPSLRLSAQGEEVAIDGERLRQLALEISATELLAAPAGNAVLHAAMERMELSLSSDFRVQDDNLRLEQISLVAPDTRVNGDLELNRQDQTIEGELHGEASRLAALAPLLPVPLDGRVALDLRFEPKDGLLHADLALSARDLLIDTLQVKNARLDARLENLLKDPAIGGGLQLEGLAQGAVQLARLSLGFDGNRSALDWTLGLNGQAVQPVALDAAGSLVLVEGTALRLERISGELAGAALRLEQPALFSIVGERRSVSGLDLRLDGARLAGDVEIGRSAAQGELVLTRLPLGWIGKFANRSLTGDLGGRLTFEGTGSAPLIEASLQLDRLRTLDVLSGDLPPVDLEIAAAIGRGRLTGSLVVEGISEQPIMARVALPANLSLMPAAFSLPEDGPLEGAVDAELQLARVADILALDGQRLEGRMRAALSLGGTLAAPRVNGPVTLTGGRYENGTSGTVLKDIALDAEAGARRFTIRSLTARTGDEPNIVADGWIELDAARQWPLFARLSLDNARLVRRDDADATVSGELTISGQSTNSLIKGQVKVEKGEFSIPDGGGPDLPELEVVEVRGGAPAPSARPAGEEKQRAFDPQLEVSIGIPGQVYVRGRGLESEWEGDLDIQGRVSEPIIAGELRVKRGYFDFIDKRFMIREGIVDFAGATPPNPILSVEAAAGDESFTGIVRLVGPVTKPELILSSEPQLPEDEVLSRLLFDRELSEIGPTEAAKLALALNRLRSSGGGFDIYGEIRDILNIDTLEIVGGETPEESKVKAGKYLNDDVYIEVEQGTAEESGRARVEVEIIPNVAIEADTGQDAEGGVGLKWQFDY